MIITRPLTTVFMCKLHYCAMNNDELSGPIYWALKGGDYILKWSP